MEEDENTAGCEVIACRKKLYKYPADIPRENLFLKFIPVETDGRASKLLAAIGDAVYRSGERAGEMRKDNNNNTSEPPDHGSADDNQRRCRNRAGRRIDGGEKGEGGEGLRERKAEAG